MSEFASNSEVARQPHSEHESQFEHELESGPEGRLAAHDPGALTLSANDFSALEERILRAVEVVRRERQARAAAEERADRAEAQLREQSPQVEQLEKDLSALRAERDHVRERVERLLGQLDTLEL
jgi:predicted nuclease with TOPRIM domain